MLDDVSFSVFIDFHVLSIMEFGICITVRGVSFAMLSPGQYSDRASIQQLNNTETNRQL